MSTSASPALVSPAHIATHRILILTPCLEGKDGVSAFSRHVVRALLPEAEGGNRIEVWTLRGSDEGAAGGGSKVHGRSARGNRLRFVLWGLEAAGGNRPGLVVLTHLQLAPAVVPLIVRRCPVVVFLHGIEAWHRLRCIEGFTVRSAFAVLANSRHTLERFRAANPQCDRQEVRVCLLGLGVEDSLAATPGGGKPGRNFALIVGRMAAEERYKGHDILLDIWSSVVAAVPTASLVIAGDGDDRPRLEAKARSLGLVERVHFLGRVSDELLGRLYQECLFFVMPSRNEGFGFVFLEAMRAGKACIGAFGAAAEIIEQGRTGLLVDSEASGDVLAAVLRLFLEPDLRERMGSAGKERFLAHFTAAHFHRRFRALVGLEQIAGTTP